VLRQDDMLPSSVTSLKSRSQANKKAKLLSQRQIHISDLESPFRVQVSLCTSTVRRVQLHKLVAEIMSVYISILVALQPL
jgi:hypothetical protein